MSTSKSILDYFQKSTVKSALPDPKGPLAEEVHSSLIAAANKDVLDILEKPVASKKKGSYIKITPEEKAKIARYAIENGNCAAARKFSKHGDLDKTLGESTVRSWVAIYKKELERKRRMGETVPEITVLPQAKRGRPLLIGEKLNSAVKAYVRSVREASGIVTSSIVAAATTAMVRKDDAKLLAENGDPLSITTNWAQSLLYRMQYVLRRGSTNKKILIYDFKSIKTQFLTDVIAVVQMKDIPKDLVLNWDHTGF